MNKQKHQSIFILVVVLFSLISTASNCFALDSTSSHPTRFENPAGVPAQDQSEWEEIIRKAFQGIGKTPFAIIPNSFGGVSGFAPLVGDNPDQEINFSIQPYEPTSFQSPDPNTYSDTVFRNYPAQLATWINPAGEVYGKAIHWKMNGLYYMAYVVKPNPTDSEVINFANALYSAATGSSSSSSEPEDLPSDQTGLCAGVNCKTNYCRADGSQYLYNCACNSKDGKCYCKADDCTAGCDEALGGCLLAEASDPDDLCAHTVCSPDHCGDDGKTRYHDCKCDPADGECYCYTEVCREGCNAETGKCVEMEGLCAGVECEASFCSQDSATLNYDCACDPATGACVCRTEPCPAGCDPDTLACIQDLCVDVECPDKCENNVSSKSGHCDAATGECVYDQVTDCGLAGCQENSVECKLQSDLSIEKITVLQAVEGGTLIYSKPTVVVVKPVWSDPSHNADANVTLQIDGKPFSTLRKTLKVDYSEGEKKTFKDIAIFHIPTGYLQIGAHDFLAEAVLLNDDLIDENLENNSKQVNHNFVNSSSISLMFGYYRNLVDEAQVWSFYNKARTFLLNVFPITGVTIQTPFYELDPFVIGAEQQVATLDELHKIHNSTPDKYARYAVGLFRDGGLGEGTFGVSYSFARQSVLVGDGSSNPKAHETLAHELGHELFGDEYDVYIGSGQGKILPKNTYIYDGQRRKLSDLRLLSGDFYNIMGIAGFLDYLWVNRETWDALARHFGGQAAGLSRGPIVASPPALQVGTGSGYLLSGSISPDDQVVVQNLLPFEEMAFEKTYAGEYWVQVFNQNGKMAGEYTLEVEFTDEDPSGSYFVASVPADLEDTGELRILHGEKVIWKSTASESAPSVAISAPAGAGPLTGSVEISWQAEDGDGDALSYTLLYSADDGGSWTPLATGLESTAYTIDLERLPGGSACRLRVIASDGWHAAAADTETAFAVEDKPAKLVLEQPQDGAQFEYRQAVEMNAFAYDTEAGWIDGAGINWQSSRDGELGSGNYLSLENLSPGAHTLTAALQDPSLEDVQASVSIVVAEPPRPVGSGFSIVPILAALFVVVGGAAFLVIKKRKGAGLQSKLREPSDMEKLDKESKVNKVSKVSKVTKDSKLTKKLPWWVIAIIVVLGSLIVAFLLFMLYAYL